MVTVSVFDFRIQLEGLDFAPKIRTVKARSFALVTWGDVVTVELNEGVVENASLKCDGELAIYRVADGKPDELVAKCTVTDGEVEIIWNQ